MFIVESCRYEGCSRVVLDGLDFCQLHHANAQTHMASIKEKILATTGVLERCNWSGVDFSGMDFSGREFFYCCFTESCLNQVDFTGSRFFMCMLDGLEAVGAQFTGVQMISVFAASSNFSESNFSGSDIVNTNFNGIIGHSSVFNESDLQFSRFVSASLMGAEFCDCNLRMVDFSHTVLTEECFKYSNMEDAYRPPESLQ